MLQLAHNGTPFINIIDLINITQQKFIKTHNAEYASVRGCGKTAYFGGVQRKIYFCADGEDNRLFLYNAKTLTGESKTSF